jgi:ribosomal protein S18 acetylase RimI-like enzyme
MRTWPGDPSTRQLVLLDHDDVPRVDEVRAWTDHCRRLGAHRVRTSALRPEAAEVFLRCGFLPIDRLALLEIDPRRRVPSPPTGSSWRVGRVHRRDITSLIDLDRAAFPPPWGHDEQSWWDARRATPRSRARLVEGRSGGFDGPAGYALSGHAGHTGYLQRLAVDRRFRGQGIGRLLVDDALAAMERRRCRSVLVNTGIDNRAALSLYEAVGFRRRADELIVAERAV